MAQEAVRKPSTLRRPPARTVEPISSKNRKHVTTLSTQVNGRGLLHLSVSSVFLLFLDCLNCSRITALSDRLNSLEAKVRVTYSATDPEPLTNTTGLQETGIYF